MGQSGSDAHNLAIEYRLGNKKVSTTSSGYGTTVNNPFNVESPRKLRQLEKKLSRFDLRKLLAIRETAQTHFKSQATWQLVQQSINARVDAIDDPEELKQLNRFCDQLFNGHVTQLRARARLSM